MVFAEVLKEAGGRLEGCIGLVVMGMDGIPIEKLILDDGVNFEMLSTECTTILRNTRQASQDVGGGRLRELIIQTDAFVVLVEAITEDYVLLGTLRPGGPYGRARYLLRQASSKLEKEFL